MFKIPLIATICSFIIGCGNGYVIENGKVYMKNWNAGTGGNKHLIKGADPKTFQKYKNSKYYSRDKYHVFYKTETIKDADPKTFRPIIKGYGRNNQYAHYGKDKNFGFYYDKKIEDSDGKSFEQIKAFYSYSRDKNNIYYDDQKTLADVKTFKLLEYNWGKDKNYYYYPINDYGNYVIKRFKLKDYDSFRVISRYFALDKYNVYYENYIVKGADSKTFRVLNENDEEGYDKNRKYEVVSPGVVVNYDILIELKNIK